MGTVSEPMDCFYHSLKVIQAIFFITPPRFLELIPHTNLPHTF